MALTGPGDRPDLRSRWRGWCAAVLASLVVSLALVAGVNAIVDPFQQYRLAAFYTPRFYTLHHRYINPGLAKHAAYESVLIGSSIMESTPNDVVGKACGAPAINLSMPAISAAEIRALLDTVFHARVPRRVILVLDFNDFAGAPDERQQSAGPFPAYLYDRNVFDDLPYLLSGTVLHKSLSVLLRRNDESFRTDANAPWFWADRMRFGRAEVLRGLDLAHLNARYLQPARTVAGMQASFERNVLPVLHAHPETTFDLVWPPYSMLVWVDFAQRDQLEPTLRFKRYVAQAVEPLRNVHVTDLQGHVEITGNLDLYRDIYHFAPQVNRWMVERTCAGLDRENVATVDGFARELRDRLSAWRPPAVTGQ